MPPALHTEPTARTHHTCDDCGRAINPGEKYLRSFVIDDCGRFTWKRCAHCRAFLHLYCDQINPAWWDEGIGDDDIHAWEPNTSVAVEHKRRRLIGWRHGRDLYPIPTSRDG